MSIDILKDKSILYVEDDVMTRDLMKTLMSRYFKEFHVASCVDDALEIYKRVDPDMVVSDYQMAGRNGGSLYLELKKERDVKPFVFLTAYPEDVEETFENVENMIPKPIMREDFLLKVANIFKNNTTSTAT